MNASAQNSLARTVSGDITAEFAPKRGRLVVNFADEGAVLRHVDCEAFDVIMSSIVAAKEVNNALLEVESDGFLRLSVLCDYTTYILALRPPWPFTYWGESLSALERQYKFCLVSLIQTWLAYEIKILGLDFAL